MPTPIARRPFGRTGHLSSVTLFGAAAFSNVTQDEADRTLETLLTYGVNHIDTAPGYGDSELRIGAWMASTVANFFWPRRLVTEPTERRRTVCTAPWRGFGFTRST
jgi:predicted aldo/keto reductase-like oxidoreductase